MRKEPFYVIKHSTDDLFFIEQFGDAYVWGVKKDARLFSESEVEQWLADFRKYYGECVVLNSRSKRPARRFMGR
jgi:hypothetical protein